MKRRFLALVLAGCLAAVLSTAVWATSPTGFYLNVEAAKRRDDRA